MPVMGAAMVMFFMAALIEGFLSPSGRALLAQDRSSPSSPAACWPFYFVVLGFPRGLTMPKHVRRPTDELTQLTS